MEPKSLLICSGGFPGSSKDVICSSLVSTHSDEAWATELEGSSVTGETHLSPSRRFKKLINSNLKVREPVNHQVADINNQRILPCALVKNREALYKLLC